MRWFLPLVDRLDRRMERLRDQLFRWRLAKLPNVTIADNAEIHPSALLESKRGGIWQGGSIHVDSKSCIMEGVVLAPWMDGAINIGKRVFIGPYAIIYGEGGVTIGDDCMIAGHCFIVSSNHQTARTDLPIAELPASTQGIRIGRNVWIGAGAIVLDGVQIGDHCVVGAGAVVTRSVSDRTMVVGNPARVIRSWAETPTSRTVKPSSEI